MKNLVGLAVIFFVSFSFLHVGAEELSSDNFDLPDEYPEQEEKKEEQISPERISQLQVLARQLPDIIAEIQQKATSSRQLDGLLSAWKYALDQAQQISFLLQDELYAKVASSKKFDGFYDAFTSFSARLEDINKQFEVPEFRLQAQDIRSLLGLTPGVTAREVSNAYQTMVQEKLGTIEKLKKQDLQKVQAQKEIKRLQADIARLEQVYGAFVLQEKAFEMTKTIIREIYNLIDKKLFDDFKKIEEAYKQEAAKIKKEQEEKEAIARAEQQQGAVPDYWDYGDYDWADDWGV